MSSVDVIVPCYRYGHFLRECVESVLSQSGVEVRVLIIDDASPDDTAEIGAALADEDARVTFLRHNKNQGHIQTYNEGIEWVSSAYMLLLSADDYLLPGALHRAAQVMNDNIQVGFTFGRALRLYDDGIKQHINNYEGEPQTDKFTILTGTDFIFITEKRGAINIVPTPTAVVRTELQKKLGGYRAELPHSGDMEMWLRLAAHSSVGKLDAYQAVWRRHGENMQNTYYSNGGLADLQQRKAAIDYFLASSNRVLPDARELHDRLLKALAKDAVGASSAAFGQDNREISEEISQFACNLWPEVRRTRSWHLLAIKRLIGNKLWRILAPAAARIRKMAANTPREDDRRSST